MLLIIKRAASLTIRTIMLSLQALLCEAIPDDPQDATVAKMYMEDHKKFTETAKYWTNVFALPEGCSKKHAIHSDLTKKVADLAEINGIDKTKSLIALSNSNWEIAKAVGYEFM